MLWSRTVAQLGLNQWVPGSSPGGGARKIQLLLIRVEFSFSVSENSLIFGFPYVGLLKDRTLNEPPESNAILGLRLKIEIHHESRAAKIFLQG